MIITTPKDGTGILESRGGDYAAAIGSDRYSSSGTVTINGGNVSAIARDYGAGIGSGECGDSDIITINGGSITTKGGSYGAGIGGGSEGNSKVITINGGTINTTAGMDASGIGGGSGSDGGSITINAGTITADGGSGHGAGIGFGCGYIGTNTTITINGGNIIANGGYAGIGGNGIALCGSLNIDNFDGNVFVGANKDSLEQLTISNVTEFINNHDQIYVKFEQNECLAEGTLINMADGSKKAVELIEAGDHVLSFNHYLGKVEESIVVASFEYLEKKFNGFTLTFDNGSKVNVAGGHSFFEKKANKYVLISLDNYKDYIGSYFYDAITESWNKLVNVELINKPVRTFVLGTYNNINCIADDMLCNEDGEYLAFVNVFDFKDDLTYDEKDIEESIKKYGLWYLENQDYITQEMIDAGYGYLYDAYNLKYFNIMEKKGLLGTQTIKDIVISNYENTDEFVE